MFHFEMLRSLLSSLTKAFFPFFFFFSRDRIGNKRWQEAKEQQQRKGRNKGATGDSESLERGWHRPRLFFRLRPSSKRIDREINEREALELPLKHLETIITQFHKSSVRSSMRYVQEFYINSSRNCPFGMDNVYDRFERVYDTLVERENFDYFEDKHSIVRLSIQSDSLTNR